MDSKVSEKALFENMGNQQSFKDLLIFGKNNKKKEAGTWIKKKSMQNLIENKGVFL